MSVLWAGNFIVGRIAMREIPALPLVWLRSLFSTILLIPLTAATSRPGEWPGMRRSLGTLLLAGVLGVAINQSFYFYGLRTTSLAHAVVIGSLSPLIIFIISYFAGHESMNGRKVVGIVVAILASAVLTNLRHTGNGLPPTLSGDACVLISACAFASAGVLGRGLTQRFTSATINLVSYGAGVVLLFPFVFGELRVLWSTGLSAAAWMSLFYLSALSSVLAYVIFYWAINRIGATRASVFTYMQPVLVTVMGMVFLGEHISWPESACAAVILAGVFLTERG